MSNANLQFRKKPIVIEAFQWTGGPDQTDDPEWIVEAINAGNVGFDKDGLNIVTLEGVLTASSGDWIIRGVKGELYPCKPDIFAATYEHYEGPTAERAVIGEEINGEAPLTFFQVAADIDLNAADFSDALMWLKEGKRVQRAGWNGKNQYVERCKFNGNVFVSDSDQGISYPMVDVFGLKNAHDQFVPGWVPSVGDLMATDWQVFIEQPVSDIPPHQMRVLQELNEVSSRHAKLLEFTCTELFASLDEQERDRLIRQVNTMGDYCAVLGERVAAF